MEPPVTNGRHYSPETRDRRCAGLGVAALAATPIRFQAAYPTAAPMSTLQMPTSQESLAVHRASVLTSVTAIPANHGSMAPDPTSTASHNRRHSGANPPGS